MKHSTNTERRCISILKDSFPGNFLSRKIIPITEAAVNSIIHSLMATKSSCYDKITSEILKARASLISHPLNYIYDHLLYTGIFPHSLKIALVKPLYKKGDKTSTTNYRPIPLLAVFPKVIKKAMHCRLSQDLCTYNILVTELYGIRKGISIGDAAFRLANSVFKYNSQKMHLGGLFCDLAKTLDTVNLENCLLNYISVEFEEYLKIGSDPM